MSVIDCRTKAGGPTCSAQVQGSGSDAYVSRRYEVEFVVRTDDVADGPRTIIEFFGASLDWPGLGDTYAFGNESDTGVWCSGIDPRRDPGEPTLWIVRHVWTDLKDERQKPDDEGKLTTNPLLWRPDVEVDFIDRNSPAIDAILKGGMIGDADAKWPIGTVGLPINSAGVPFDPPVERDDFIRCVRITKYVATYDEAVWDAYENVVNSEAYAFEAPRISYKGSWPAYTARIPRVQGSLSFENQVQHWRVTLPILIDKRYGWRRKILDRGFHAKAEPGDPDGRGGTIPQAAVDAGVAYHRVLTDHDGYPLSTPVPFDGEGKPLEPGEEQVYLTYAIYPREVAFSGLSELP